MGRKCNCKADRNIEQLKVFFNRGRDKEGDSRGTRLHKHALRVLGNAVAIASLPISIPLVLLHVWRNEKKGVGRVFRFNSNKWKAYINHELSNYKQKETK